MKTITAFIFDLDGVITDTSEFHYQAWQRLANEEGIPFTRKENEKLRGVSRRESLEVMLKGRTIPEATAQAWMERKNNYYLDLVQTITPKDVLPGVLELLAEIKASGFKAAIASSSKNAPLVISKLALQPYFDAIVDGLKVTKSKPAPDLFLQAAVELNASPEECVIFEDAEAGIDAGKAAAMATVGLGPQERVGHADIVLPGLQGVVLKNITARL